MGIDLDADLIDKLTHPAGVPVWVNLVGREEAGTILSRGNDAL